MTTVLEQIKAREHAAETDFDAHWFERNFVVVRK